MRYWRPLMVTLTWAMGEFPFIDLAGSIAVGCNDGPDGAHRLVDPAHRLSIGAFKLAGTGPCRIKFGRKPRSIDVEDMNLLGKRTAAAGAPESLLQDGIERIKRIDHTFDGLIESARAARHVFWSGHVLTASIWSPFRPPVLNLTVIVNRASTQTPVPRGVLPSLSGTAGVPPAVPASFVDSRSLHANQSAALDGGVAPGSWAREACPSPHLRILSQVYGSS